MTSPSSASHARLVEQLHELREHDVALAAERDRDALGARTARAADAVHIWRQVRAVQTVGPAVLNRAKLD